MNVGRKTPPAHTTKLKPFKTNWLLTAQTHKMFHVMSFSFSSSLGETVLLQCTWLNDVPLVRFVADTLAAGVGGAACRRGGVCVCVCTGTSASARCRR